MSDQTYQQQLRRLKPRYRRRIKRAVSNAVQTYLEHPYRALAPCIHEQARKINITYGDNLYWIVYQGVDEQLRDMVQSIPSDWQTEGGATNHERN